MKRIQEGKRNIIKKIENRSSPRCQISHQKCLSAFFQAIQRKKLRSYLGAILFQGKESVTIVALKNAATFVHWTVKQLGNIAECVKRKTIFQKDKIVKRARWTSLRFKLRERSFMDAKHWESSLDARITIWRPFLSHLIGWQERNKRILKRLQIKKHLFVKSCWTKLIVQSWGLKKWKNTTARQLLQSSFFIIMFCLIYKISYVELLMTPPSYTLKPPLVLNILKTTN